MYENIWYTSYTGTKASPVCYVLVSRMNILIHFHCDVPRTCDHIYKVLLYLALMLFLHYLFTLLVRVIDIFKLHPPPANTASIDVLRIKQITAAHTKEHEDDTVVNIPG